MPAMHFSLKMVAAFVKKESLLEGAETGIELEDLRGRCCEEVELIRISGLAASSDPLVSEF